MGKEVYVNKTIKIILPPTKGIANKDFIDMQGFVSRFNKGIGGNERRPQIPTFHIEATLFTIV
jgi:hypothetical protein